MCCGILCKFIAYIISGVGIAAIIIGAILGFAVLPNNLRDDVESRVRLEHNSPQFERWRILPFTQQMKIYFFEIVNLDAIRQNPNIRPQVAEKGPYVYNVRREKRNIQRDNDEDTLTYNEYLQFTTFDGAASVGPETDPVVLLNAPLMTLLQAVESRGLMPQNLNQEIATAFPGANSPFQQFTVRQFLFDGFPFCSTPIGPNLCPTDVDSIDYIQQQGNSLSFAFLRHRNNAHDGTYVITAGMDDIDDLGLIRSWNGATTLPNDIWGTTGQCREIRGRDSTIFPPDVHRNDDFDIYYSDICRVVKLEHVGNEDFEDISSQRREFADDTMSNQDDNACFCSRETRLPNGVANCWPNGFTDLHTCSGSHMVLSYPHFLGASSLHDMVTGLDPQEDNHTSYTLIEPGTGTALKIVKRFQYNMVLRPFPNVDITAGMPPAVFPLLWIEETMELTENWIDKIHDVYLFELRNITIITWVLIGGGIAIFIASIVLKLLCCC